MTSVSERIEARIAHRFRNRELLERALTHRSAGSRHNERLEFLGDAALTFLAAEALYERLPVAREGRLTRLRARLVRRETLAATARDIGLGEALLLGTGELKSGGRDKDSILADALEALLGAVYLDAGLDACRACFLRLMAPRMADAVLDAGAKDPKTTLQEWLQARHLPLPDYEVAGTRESPEGAVFTVECRVAGLGATVAGQGKSRRRAEQEAARRALALINHERA